MLPTFVIGLREGLEAALIVGIIAAFLRKQGRPDLLRWVVGGVVIAILLCLGVGVALRIYSQDLPQRQQEGLETVVGVVAVTMVTYMVIWMRRNARQLKSQLESLAAEAMGSGRSRAGTAMVAMAFLAVIREGLETVVFLLAAFNETGSSTAAGFGAVLGIVIAIGIGYGIYRGGVRLNLSKFFRATGLVLVLVAAGLVVNAVHTAHEAGWLNWGQGSTVNLNWLVKPGTVQSSLLTGMLGIQPQPVVAEVVAWFCYLIPVGLYVAWPPDSAAPARLLARSAAVLGLSAAIAALVLVLAAPAEPAIRPVTQVDTRTAQVVSRSGDTLIVRTEKVGPIRAVTGVTDDLKLASIGATTHAGLPVEAYRARVAGPGVVGQPSTLTAAQVASRNGGRLPIGLGVTGGRALAMHYADDDTLTVWVDDRTERVIDASWTERITATVSNGTFVAALDTPVAAATEALPAVTVTAAVAQVRSAHSDLDHRALVRLLALWCVVLAAVSLLVAVGFALAARRRPRTPESSAKADATPTGVLDRG